MRHIILFPLIAALFVGLHGPVFPITAIAEEQPGKAGNIEVSSSQIGTRVYVDDTYKGDADIFIDKVSVGQHTITCRQGSQTVSDTFTINEGETLKLKALFDSGKIVNIAEAERLEAERKTKEAQAKVEAEKKEAQTKLEAEKKEAKARADAKRQEDLRKQAEEARRAEELRKAEAKKAETKKVDQKSSVDERRELHLNIIKFYIEDTDQDVHVTHKANARIIGKYADRKNLTGKFYKTKKDVLLCDAGPCQKEWTASFSYTDEAGKTDSFTVSWKETVFNAITPNGTSKRNLDWCLNGACKKLEDAGDEDRTLESEMDRYVAVMTRSSVRIRRADIAQEIISAGKALADYQ